MGKHQHHVTLILQDNEGVTAHQRTYENTTFDGALKNFTTEMNDKIPKRGNVRAAHIHIHHQPASNPK